MSFVCFKPCCVSVPAIALVARAEALAERWHGDQKRKYSSDPYIVHPREVAAIVKTVAHTPEMIAAALLHDVVEDRGVTLAEITEELGAPVAELVGWLTDVSRPEDGNRAKRKALDLAHTANAPAEAQTVKLADLISNARSIVQHDPNFAKVFLKEGLALLDVLVRGDADLMNRARKLLENAVAALPPPRPGRNYSE